jgi:xanthine dehydrogenase molybdenum-binding subunit
LQEISFRAAELRSGRWRHASVVHVKVGATRDGDLTALEGRAVFNTGPYSPSQRVTRRAGYSLTYLYHCANVRYDGHLAYTNAPVAGSYRSPGGVQAHFALESQMDEVARALDMDPLAFRLRNRIGPQGQPSERRSTPGGLVPSQPEEPGLPFSSYGLERCLREGAECIGWHTPTPAPRGSWRRGRGIAMTVYQTGQVPVASAMGLDADGAIWLRMGTKDVGQGSDTALLQIAAATLGVDIQQFRTTFADTSATPRSAMTSGSGMTFSAGLAAQQAAEQLREALVTAGARELEASVEDVELRRDRLQVRGAATESVSLADLAARLGDARSTVHVAVRPGSTTHVINSFAAHFAEVDVDTETGAINVVRYVAAHDSGRIINPLLARGQVEGALAQAIGFALMERLPIDPDSGAPLASNLGDFRYPDDYGLATLRRCVRRLVRAERPLRRQSSRRGAHARARPCHSQRHRRRRRRPRPPPPHRSA